MQSISYLAKDLARLATSQLHDREDALERSVESPHDAAWMDRIAWERDPDGLN